MNQISLENFWKNNLGRIPDYEFPGVSLDPRESDEMKSMCPLLESRHTSPKQYLIGTYIFWQDIENSDPVLMYAGKAVRLRARLAQHWSLSTWLQDWSELYPFDFDPQVSVWLTNNNAELEARAISVFNPRYNLRRE